VTLSILMTGAAGYVGSYLAPRLAGLPSHRVELLNADVTAPNLQIPDADVIVHLAGKLNSFGGPEAEIERTNLGGTINLARTVVQRHGRGRTHFVFLSTDQVFGSDAERVYTEADPVAPQTVYGRSKAKAEEFLLSTLDRVTILRTAILYGYSHPRRRNTVEFIESKLRAGQPIELYRDVFACPTFIGDLAACVQRVIEERILGVHHACGPEYLSRCEIAEILCGARGYDRGLIRPIARPESSNVPRCLHLRPSTSLQELLASRLADGLFSQAQGAGGFPAQTALP
jgi:dTDP-4-dehydrorhamnose reductase